MVIGIWIYLDFGSPKRSFSRFWEFHHLNIIQGQAESFEGVRLRDPFPLKVRMKSYEKGHRIQRKQFDKCHGNLTVHRGLEYSYGLC